MRLLLCTLTAVVLLASSAAPATARAKKTSLYTVQPGDSCWSIAQRFFGKGERYDIIHRYNRLGPLPHLLKPGQKIRLPIGRGGADARVNWLRRDVKARAPRAVDWRRARRNMELWKLYRVSTGKRSSAGIRFVDQSHLRMRAKALLVIYGSSSKRTRLKRTVKTTVVLKRGTIKGGLARLDREAGLEVRTPSSKVNLKSKLSQVQVDRLKTSIVSVYNGFANVLARGLKVTVPKNYGTYVKRGRRPAKPIPLPAAPTWTGKSGDAVVLVPPGHKGGFEARWVGPKRARRYRVEVARDARFNQIMVDAVVGAGIRRFRASKLSLGTYWARVASIDRHKLEGRPSAPIKVKLLALKSSRRLHRSTQGEYIAVGLLRLNLQRQHGAAVEVSVNGSAYGTAADAVRLSKPGRYNIRCRIKGKKTTSELKVRLLAVKSSLRGTTRGVRVGGSALPLSVALQDDRGNPAVLPGLYLRADPGGAVRLLSTAAGQYTATLRAPARYPGKVIRLTLGWAAGVLASTEVAVTSPPPRHVPPTPIVKKRVPVKPPIVWRTASAAFEWGRPGPGLPSRTGIPATYLGLSSLVADRDAGSGTREVALRLALRGGLSLLKGRLGLDLDLPWYAGDITQEPVSESELGIPRLGLRVLAWQGHGITLTPSLRISGHSATRQVVTVEPGLIFEWRHRKLLTLGTNQVLAADASVKKDAWTDSSLFYSSAYYANVRPLSWLSVTAELGLAVALTGPRELKGTIPVTLGGTLWFHPGRVRVGVTAAGGLTDDARRLLGRYTVGLSLDLAYRGL